VQHLGEQVVRQVHVRGVMADYRRFVGFGRHGTWENRWCATCVSAMWWWK